jgi:hypothetical protein
MARMIDGVEQFCCLCDGQASRRNVPDRRAYDVDCATCGSYRIGLGGELSMGRTTYMYRENVANRVRAANQSGFILDLSTGTAFLDERGRLPE